MRTLVTRVDIMRRTFGSPVVHPPESEERFEINGESYTAGEAADLHANLADALGIGLRVPAAPEPASG